MSQTISRNFPDLQIDGTRIGIALLWLFHLSAIIGISLGYHHWFASKTPLNLSIIFLLLVWLFPLDSVRKLVAGSLFFIAGMLVEWLGVNYSLLFGSYEYGNNLGSKLDGVPLLIGVNWAILVLVTGVLANRLSRSLPLRVFLGASLMVGLDFLLEVAAPRFDYWYFEGGVAPLSNYLAWFVIAAVLHALFQALRIRGNLLFCLHLFLCQLLFFGYFFVYFMWSSAQV